jgi:hypothetical protein
LIRKSQAAPSFKKRYPEIPLVSFSKKCFSENTIRESISSTENGGDFHDEAHEKRRRNQAKGEKEQSEAKNFRFG